MSESNFNKAQEGQLIIDIKLVENLRENGQWKEALEAAKKIANLTPLNDEVWALLAHLFNQVGEANQAEASAKKALSINSENYSALRALSGIRLQQQKFDEADYLAERALTIAPNCPRNLMIMAAIAMTKLNPDLAIAKQFLLKAISKEPLAEIYANLASLEIRLGNLEEAKRCAEIAVGKKPFLVNGWLLLANICKNLGEHDTTLKALEEIIKYQPNNEEVLSDLGGIYRQKGRLSDAIKILSHAIKFPPKIFTTWVNYGATLQELKRDNEAIDAYRNALRLNPNVAEVYINLGALYNTRSQFNLGIECSNKALSIDPKKATAYNNLGIALSAQGRFNEAIVSYRNALEIMPELSSAYSNLLFCLNYHPDMSAESIYSEYQKWNDRYAKSQPLRRFTHFDSSPARRLRIGYVSPDLCNHSVIDFFEPLLCNHNKLEFEIFAYANVKVEDEVSERLKNYFDHWINTINLDDTELAEKINKDSIDILVDLAGHTSGNRLLMFAQKPAPVQVSWLGYGYTTGLNAIDYYLSDKSLTPQGSESLFSEKLLRLPFFTTYRPKKSMGEPGNLPALQKDFVTFGSLSRSIRINSRVIRVWAEILKRMTKSRLIIDSKNFNSEEMQARVLKQFEDHGVDPQRISVGYSTPPWDVLRNIDITLDSFPHNSGTTLFESLYLGVPFVTLIDRPSVGRLGVSILNALGHSEWAASSEEEYINKAVMLGSDLNALSNIREKLRTRMTNSILMNEQEFARSVESQYQSIWQHWRNNYLNLK